MIVSFILFIIIIICVATYVGLNIAQKVENNSVLYIFFWIIYIVVLIGIFNIVLLANFWDTIQHKTGPPGPRGPMGEQGETGDKGVCGNDCRFKQGILFIHEMINTKLIKLTGQSIFIIKKYVKYDKSEGEKKLINPEFNKFILEKVNQMMNSKQYKITAPIKGTNNLNNYLEQIWDKWIDLLADAGATKENFFFDKFADDTLWVDGNEEMKKKNPFPEMEKYDVYVWGQLRAFKPLNIEICSNSRQSNYFPQEYKKPLQTIITNRYQWMYNSYNETTYTGKRQKNDHISIWRPLKHTFENEIYYPVGDVIFSSNDRTRYGENGLKVIQLTAPDTQPGYYGFSPEPKPQLIAWWKTEYPALALSKGLDRDRGVDETGGQIAVFGRLGSRPFSLKEMQKLYLKNDREPYLVEDNIDGIDSKTLYGKGSRVLVHKNKIEK